MSGLGFWCRVALLCWCGFVLVLKEDACDRREMAGESFVSHVSLASRQHTPRTAFIDGTYTAEEKQSIEQIVSYKVLIK